MNPPVLYQWTEEIAMRLPSLHSWQVENLALFSYGVIVAESSQQMKIARKVACGEQVSSAERRLRRFIANQQVALSSFFVEWTRWMVSCRESPQVTLLVDETKLKAKLAMMLVGVAFEGRCIPLAWQCYRANSKRAYPEQGQVKLIGPLLQQVKQGLPPSAAVLVLADRGIGTSPALCQPVDGLGWKYLFRVTKQSKILTDDGEYSIYQQVQRGQRWCASGWVFKKRARIPAHARALWSASYDEPWALVTNDARLTGYEYAQRNWQEQSFRDLKSGGWQWSRSGVRCPARMSRLLLLLVVADAWVVGSGSYAIHWQRARTRIHRPTGQLRRQWSVFKEGLQLFSDYVLRNNVGLKPCFGSDQRLC
jgi:hypothetical protein